MLESAERVTEAPMPEAAMVVLRCTYTGHRARMVCGQFVQDEAVNDVTLRVIVVATQNAGKVREFAVLLADLPARFVTAREVGVLELPEETGTTFAENAAIKAHAVAEATGLPALADDSGLVVDALGGAPGVFSARYGGAGLTDRDRYTLVLNQLRDAAPAGRTARFVAVLAFVLPDGAMYQAEGYVEGAIVDAPRGSGGFGYDPIFVPYGESRTFAEIPADEKNRMSHRARALAALRPTLERLVRGTSQGR
jgi:XTP/dITP diphosphohydrolase